MRPNPKLDADFYRKVNQQLHTKDRLIRALQQRLDELQARVSSHAVDPAGLELELELAELEQQIQAQAQADAPAEAPARDRPHVQLAPALVTPIHPAHDAALMLAAEPPPAPDIPAPHVPSPLLSREATYLDATPPPPRESDPAAPAAHAVPEASPRTSLPDRLTRKVAALRPHLTDPTMDDGEILHTALRLYDWFLRRHAQGYRVQLVNDEDTTTEVDLVL